MKTIVSNFSSDRLVRRGVIIGPHTLKKRSESADF